MKHHNPAELAAEYMRLGKEGTVCPHGVDRFERRGKLLVNLHEWICACCCHVFQGGSGEDMLCEKCI